MGSVVSPSGCVVLGDTVGWAFFSITASSSSIAYDFGSYAGTLTPPFFSCYRIWNWCSSLFFLFDTVALRQCEQGFLDRHVESLNLQELTLPVESIHRRYITTARCIWIAWFIGMQKIGRRFVA